MSGGRADANDARVGRNIRALRMAKRMSQTALADEIGVTFQQVQKYENGRNRVSAGRLLRISAVLHVPVIALLYGAPGLERHKTLSVLAHAPAVRLIKAFKAIGDDDLRRMLLALIEGIARLPLGKPRSSRAPAPHTKKQPGGPGCSSSVLRFSVLVAAPDAFHASVVALDRHGAAVSAAQIDVALDIARRMIDARAVPVAILVLTVRLADAYAAERGVDREALRQRRCGRRQHHGGGRAREDDPFSHGIFSVSFGPYVITPEDACRSAKFQNGNLAAGAFPLKNS